MKIFQVVFLFTFFVSFNSVAWSATTNEIGDLIQKGEFTQAKKAILLHIAEEQPAALQVYQWNCKKQILDRIERDFRRERPEIFDFVKHYYPDVNDAMLDRFESDGALEMKILDGKKKYFANAAPNLFRIDPAARERKREIDSPKPDSLELLFKKHLPNIIADAKKSGTPQGEPVRMKVQYTLTLKDGVVPDGEVVRCWLPYPRLDHRRQKDVKLISVNSPNYVISPDEYLHKTLYMEKTVQKGTPTVFQHEFSYTSIPEWFDLKPEQMQPYDKESDLYKKYTAERSTHVIFTDKIKKLSEKIVGDEKNPLLIAEKTWGYICDHYPWASALEYSTQENIPEYVIDKNYGDCGMVSLLFITICRYNGVPAKWQSGFMMHPNSAGMHDWAEVYFEGIGWVPVDTSFGRRRNMFPDDPESTNFFARGMDAYRLIVNEDYSQPLYPAKTYLRSETIDFQRGEVEWKAGNLYFNDWTYDIDVEYLSQ